MRTLLWGVTVGIMFVSCALLSEAGDLSLVSVLDGERQSMLNNWGGEFNQANLVSLDLETTIVHSGQASYRADVGTLNQGSSRFFQTFSSERTAEESLRQTRDLTRYSEFEAHVYNDTGAPLNLKWEIKDYRNDLGHQAFVNFPIPATAGWTKIEAPLDVLQPEWTTVGSPDLSRSYVTSFVITPTTGTATGNFYLDDFALRETGGTLDTGTVPLENLVERLARRQFLGLFDSRNRSSSLTYNSKNDVNLAAMNTTGGTLWMLPKAIERGWVTQTEADNYAAQLVTTLNTNLDHTNYLPSRFIHPASGNLPGGDNEESSIDASFLALALHRYKNLPGTSATLATSIDQVQNRFDLATFANGSGFRLAYFPATGFTGHTYNGYTNEGKVISLAAEVSTSHHVPLEQHWNADTSRTRTSLVDPDNAHLVHSNSLFRAPFEQALLNLFVDTSDHGVDNYPNRALATNPWHNYLRYEQEVADKLQELGRDQFFQPDAGSGAPFSDYHQYSLYNDFGQPDLFMPWSISLALLAGAEGAETALRALLDVDGMTGPLGWADSARWDPNDSLPYFISDGGDNWNTVLSTMALLELLDNLQDSPSASDQFAALADVSAALGEVFVDGDLTGDGITDGTDLAIWQNGYGQSAGATPAEGDTDGDGDVDGLDFFRWQQGIGGAVPSFSAVPEPTCGGLLMVGLALLLGCRYEREN